MKVTVKPNQLGNQTLGRGKVYVAGRYVGNTPCFNIIREDGLVRVEFVGDDMSLENVKMFFAGERGEIRYVACNPCGPNINFTFLDAEITGEGTMQVKGDDWMVLPFKATLHPNDKGELLTYAYPVRHTVSI